MQSASARISRLRIALGTFVAIEAVAGSEAAAQRAVEDAFAALGTVGRLMHPTRPGSDLAAIAAAAPGDCVRVHPWSWEVLRLSRRLWDASAGLFDPCLASAPGRMSDLDLLDGEGVVPRKRTHIDAGGIAKGFAVDRAIEILRASGCAAGLVNAGGDLAVFGAVRRILCRGPAGSHCALELDEAAVATSCTGESRRPVEHRGHYHGIDRRRTVSGSATVVAGSAAVADALTKWALIAEPAPRVLAALDARIIKMPIPGRDRCA